MIKSKITWNGFFILLFVVLYFSVLNTTNAFARTITVPDEYITIQQAIEESISGDTIFVKSGTYAERLVIDKMLIIIGENKNNTIIDCMNDYFKVSGLASITIDHADYVELRNFTFSTGNIRVEHVSFVTISDNLFNNSGLGFNAVLDGIISNNTFINGGFSTYSVKYPLQFRSNRFYNSSIGQLHASGEIPILNMDESNTLDNKPFIMWHNVQNKKVPENAAIVHLWNCNNITIENVNISSVFRGIRIINSENCTIENNELSDNYYGIVIEGESSNSFISNNHISNSECGISLNVQTNEVSTNAVVTNNLIEDSITYDISIVRYTNSIISNNQITSLKDDVSYRGIGLQLNYIKYNEITNNTISKRQYGILLDLTSKYNDVNKNNIFENEFGMLIKQDSFSNIIYNNNFIQNINNVQIIDVVNSWNDSRIIGGNFWDDYGGVDTNLDLIGDSSYVIDEYNIDNYPLMIPFEDYLRNMIEIEIDKVYYPDRVDLGSLQKISYHVKWIDNNSDVTSGNIIINSISYPINDTGFARLDVLSNEVDQIQYSITGVNISGITEYYQSCENASIIWDTIEINDYGYEPYETTEDDSIRVWVKTRYEYDGQEFTGNCGTLFINGSAGIWSDENRRWEYSISNLLADTYIFRVSEIIDTKYGLTETRDNVGDIVVLVHESGWGADWTVIGGNPQHTGSSIMASRISIPLLLWKYENSDGWSGSIAVGDINGISGNEVVYTISKTIFAVSGPTGDYLWNFTTLNYIVSTPAIGDIDGDGRNEVVLVSQDGICYALDGITGDVLWEYATDKTNSAVSPVLFDVNDDGALDAIVSGQHPNYIVALSGVDGTVIWSVGQYSDLGSVAIIDGKNNESATIVLPGSQIQLVHSTDGTSIWNQSVRAKITPSVIKKAKYSVIICGGWGQELYALNSTTGEILWENSLGGELWTYSVVGDVDGDSIIDVIIPSRNGNLFVFNSETGERLWYKDLGVFDYSPALIDLNGDSVFEIIVPSRSGNLFALNGTNGNIMWEVDSYARSHVVIADVSGNGESEFLILTSTGLEVYGWDSPPLLHITSSISGYKDEISLGYHVNATYGFDESYDELKPPTPPKGVSSYIQYPNNDPLYQDLSISRIPESDRMNWTISTLVIDISGQVTLIWEEHEIIKFPNKYLIRLRLENGSELADMREQFSYTFEAETNSQHTFIVEISELSIYDIQLMAGWNMISVPCTLDNSNVDDVFSELGFYQIVTWDGSGYIVSTSIEAGKGYWVLVLEDTLLSITGKPLPEINYSLHTGWNLIGGPDDTCDVDSLLDGFYQIVTWTGYSYQKPQSVSPTKGYWLLVLTETQASLP